MEKCYHSGQKIFQPISSQKSLVTSQKIFFLALITTQINWNQPESTCFDTNQPESTRINPYLFAAYGSSSLFLDMAWVYDSLINEVGKKFIKSFHFGAFLFFGYSLLLGLSSEISNIFCSVLTTTIFCSLDNSKPRHL